MTTQLIKQAESSLSDLGYLNIEIPQEINLFAEINRLKKEKDAVLLAHYYQGDEIQELSDYLGDSLYLAKMAEKVEARMIVFAGVHFMAETAKIINPSKKVVLPDLKAGCSLADSCPPLAFQKFKHQHPDAVVVTYINCSAEIKAMSDIVCTSSNAIQVIESIPKNKKIIFAPDKNLGKYLIKQSGRDMILWEGACMVHEAFSYKKILQLKDKYPRAKFIAHPESEPRILNFADYIGSTSSLLNFVKTNNAEEFIIATEAGIIHEMKKKMPHKKFIPAPIEEDNTCACSECFYMKLNTLEKLYLCMKYELPEIKLSETLIKKARLPIERMLSLK